MPVGQFVIRHFPLPTGPLSYLNSMSSDLRLDRTVFQIRDSFDDREDCRYWWSRTPRERLEHLERLRRQNYGSRATEGLQRVLEMLSSRRVDYLVIGGYAVSWHGYPRATQDLDVWIAMEETNAAAVVEVIRQFGFDTPNLTERLFLERGRIVRMGNPPIRIEVLTTISGLEFQQAYERRVQADLGGVIVPMISLEDLKKNKRAAARHKDLDDLEHLP